jgi:hypothetical protein
MFGARRLRVSAKALELPTGGSAALLHILQQAHIAAVGEAAVAMAGAGKHGWGIGPSHDPYEDLREERSETFDPDEAMARYLASKQTRQGAPAPSRPAVPQRPVFGRRAG